MDAVGIGTMAGTTKPVKKSSYVWEDKLSILIPAYNEEGGIGGTLDNLEKMLPNAEIIVIDDGSSDRTAAEVLKRKNVRLLQHTINRGYGAGLKTGMRNASREYVAWFDADNEHREEDLCNIVDRLHNENLVAVIGERPNRGPSLTRNLGKLVITQLGRTLSVNIGDDLNCGLRVFRKNVILRYLSLLPNGFSASMTSMVVMLERGYPTVFEPIKTNPRIGESKVKLVDGFRTIMLLLRIIMLFAPLRIFLGIGVILVMLGSVYSVFMALFIGNGIPILGALIIIVGFLVAMMGLLADQISQLRLNMIEDSTESLTKEIDNV